MQFRTTGGRNIWFARFLASICLKTIQKIKSKVWAGIYHPPKHLFQSFPSGLSWYSVVLRTGEKVRTESTLFLWKDSLSGYVWAWPPSVSSSEKLFPSSMWGKKQNPFLFFCAEHLAMESNWKCYRVQHLCHSESGSSQATMFAQGCVWEKEFCPLHFILLHSQVKEPWRLNCMKVVCTCLHGNFESKYDNFNCVAPCPKP